MAEDSQLIGELERAGSKDETQGKTHSKKEVQEQGSSSKCDRKLSG